jgi:hypothetical protein
MQLNLKRAETRPRPVERQLLQLKRVEILQQQVELLRLNQSQALKAQAREQQTKPTKVSQPLTLALRLQRPRPDETKPRQAESQHLSQQVLKNLALEQQTKLMQVNQ